jgi:hypothetical protein
LAQQRVPLPPPDLAGKVLAAAAMVDAEQARSTWVDRLWESSQARLLWAVTVTVLLVGHVLATRPAPTPWVAEPDDHHVASTLLELDVPVRALLPPVSRFRVPRFHGYGSVVEGREQIDRVLEEAAW